MDALDPSCLTVSVGWGEMIDEMMRHAVILKFCSCGKCPQLYMTGMLQIYDLRSTSMLWILPTKKGIGAAVIGHF